MSFLEILFTALISIFFIKSKKLSKPILSNKLFDSFFKDSGILGIEVIPLINESIYNPVPPTNIGVTLLLNND